MLLIIGFLLVLGGCVGGFVMAGGHVASLIVPSEIVTLGGITIGLLVISSSMNGLKNLVRALVVALKGGSVAKPDVDELLKLLYELFNTARRNGLIALEDHVLDPKKSAIFTKYKSLASNHERLDFLCNGLKPLIDGRIKPDQLESLMMVSVNAKEEEASEPIHMMQLIGDSLPGIGIIAAVLGIIHTMAIVDQGAALVGKAVAGALTGTLMGVLGAYGFVNPTAAKISHNNALELQYYVALMRGLCGFAQGMAPLMAVEVSRRCLDHTLTPSADQLEEILKTVGK
jgi:chemotaxis protein MotA